MTEEQIKQKAREKAKEIEENQTIGIYDDDESLAYDKGYNSGEVTGYEEGYIAGATEATKELEAQIEKMRCCENCKFGQNRCYLKDGTGKACDEWEIKENEQANG